MRNGFSSDSDFARPDTLSDPFNFKAFLETFGTDENDATWGTAATAAACKDDQRKDGTGNAFCLLSFTLGRCHTPVGRGPGIATASALWTFNEFFECWVDKWNVLCLTYCEVDKRVIRHAETRPVLEEAENLKVAPSINQIEPYVIQSSIVRKKVSVEGHIKAFASNNQKTI